MTIDLLQVKKILDHHLGSSQTHKKAGEFSYHCPFCNHYKKKLQVNLTTQKWHCWVCNSKGLTIGSLLRKNNASPDVIQKVRSVYGDVGPLHLRNDNRELVSLPTGYKPLHIKQNSPDYRNALHYAMSVRKLTPIDILRYQVGYCDEGPYAGMLILPSYDGNNNLNYYVGRSYYKGATITHKNPPVSKDVIGFENHINWAEPLVLVEGAFDAIATKRNAIPLFGKKILPNLRARIVTERVKTIHLALDTDAFADSVKEVEYFINNGIDVSLISLPGKDPSDAGYANMIYAITNAKRVDFFDLIKYKMLI